MTVNPALPAVHQLFAAINTGDLDPLPELVTPDFVDHGSPVPLPPGPVGYATVLGFVTRVLKVSYDVQDLFCTKDRISVRAVARGRAVGIVHGEDVAGRPYVMDTLHVYRTEGARPAEHWGVRDEYGVLVRLGVLTPPRVDLSGVA